MKSSCPKLLGLSAHGEKGIKTPVFRISYVILSLDYWLLAQLLQVNEKFGIHPSMHFSRIFKLTFNS